MKQKRLHILFGSLLLILLGGSMTFSTLHSHHHIQWHQSGDFADTGNCITKDVTVCPISGYHLKHDSPEAGDTFASLPFDGYIYDQQELYLPRSPHLIDKGRSPPAIA